MSENTPKWQVFVATICPRKNCHVLRFGGYPPPPVYILYLYCCRKKGQYKGNFPVFEDDLRSSTARGMGYNLNVVRWITRRIETARHISSF